MSLSSNADMFDLSPDELAAEIERIAGRMPVAIGDVRVFNRTQVEIASANGQVSILPRPDQARFDLYAHRGSGVTAWGETADVEDILRVAVAWSRGVTLDQLHAEFPFMTYSPRAKAAETGTLVEFEWSTVMEHLELRPLRPLLRAVHENPVLGALLPSVTHLTRLSLGAHPPIPWVGPLDIVLRQDGAYALSRVTIDENYEGVPGDKVVVHTVDEAVTAAVVMWQSSES